MSQTGSRFSRPYSAPRLFRRHSHPPPTRADDGARRLFRLCADGAFPRGRRRDAAPSRHRGDRRHLHLPDLDRPAGPLRLVRDAPGSTRNQQPIIRIFAANKIVGGPKGCRPLDTDPQKDEFFVNSERKVEITFYDATLKPATPGSQVVSISANSRKAALPSSWKRRNRLRLKIARPQASPIAWSSKCVKLPVRSRKTFAPTSFGAVRRVQARRIRLHVRGTLVDRRSASCAGYRAHEPAACAPDTVLTCPHVVRFGGRTINSNRSHAGQRCRNRPRNARSSAERLHPAYRAIVAGGKMVFYWSETTKAHT
jgi:hypothetical protein